VDGLAAKLADWDFDVRPIGYDAVQFATVYSGRVVANPHDPAGALMRYRFRVAQPYRSMASDDTGEC
jgi:hypothetical protein